MDHHEHPKAMRLATINACDFSMIPSMLVNACGFSIFGQIFLHMLQVPPPRRLGVVICTISNISCLCSIADCSLGSCLADQVVFEKCDSMFCKIPLLIVTEISENKYKQVISVQHAMLLMRSMNLMTTRSIISSNQRCEQSEVIQCSVTVGWQLPN